MPRHSTYRTRGAVESVGSEWSSGQLGIGIAVAVIFGLVCFILGYVVANIDRPLVDEIVAVSGESIVPKTATNRDSPPAGATTPARPTETPPPAAQAPPAAATTPSGPSANPPQRPVGSRDVAALPAPGGPTPMVKTPVRIGGAEADTPVTAAKPDAAPAPIVPPEAPKPAPADPDEAPDLESVAGASPAPATPVSKPPVTPPAPANPPATPVAPAVSTTPAAPKPPTVTMGSYGIQVAAFNGPRRAEQAVESRKRLKEVTGLVAEIRRTPDGAFEKVIITGFSTPEAAKAQCEKLKEKAGYDSSWVVRLP